jgi:hypothetical protein
MFLLRLNFRKLVHNTAGSAPFPASTGTTEHYAKPHSSTQNSVADPDSGSGALLPPRSLSGMNFFWIPDLFDYD